MADSIYDIREDEIDIEGKPWDDEEVQRLAMKSLLITKKMIDYHEPHLQRGEELFKKYEGEIINEYQREVYEDVEDKIVIEPPIMKSPIRALLGEIISSRRSGTVSTEQGSMQEPNELANEIRLVSIVLKDMEKKTNEHVKFRDAVHNSLVACYPSVILWVKCQPTEYNSLGYDKRLLAWNSAVCGPVNISEPDMRDVKELVWFDKRSQADLELNFPDMVDQIRAHWKGNNVDDKMLSSVMGWNNAENANYRDYLLSILDAANGDKTGPAGMLQVFERIFQIRKTEEVWVSLFDDKIHEMPPESWDEERRQAWIKANEDKYLGPVERETIVLWSTVFTSSGLVLENKKHWFQENGLIPADFVVPAIINGKPSGPAIDMDDDALRNCVAQIEYLDDMRKGGGTVLLHAEGAFANPEKVPSEVSKAFGIVGVKKEFLERFGDMQKGFHEIQRNPTKAWAEYGEFAKANMYDNTRITEAMQGVSAPRQADVAKKTEISQALKVNALYIDNFNLQRERSQNLKLAMIPYMYSQHNIPVEGYDEEMKEQVSGTVNMPTYDSEGEISEIVNDITSHKYFWRVSFTDDSASAKSAMQQDAVLILNSVIGPFMQGDPSGEIMADFLSMIDNPILSEAGKKMAQRAKERAQSAGAAEQQKAAMESQALAAKAQAELEKAKKAGVTLNFTGEQIAQYPMLYQIYAGLTQSLPAQQAPAQQAPAMAGAGGSGL